MSIDFTSFYLYRFRYWIGYGLIALISVSLLVFAGLYLPGGIAEEEMDSVITSQNISLSSIDDYALINLPFHLLQRASLYFFGVSNFSIKLPALILGFLTAVGLILLLRKWFKRNIAVLGSIIAITTGQFLFIAQSGTPRILFIFWSVCLLLLGTLVARREAPRTLWKILFFVTVALSLYTPLTVYALLALLLAALLHPHLRFIVRQLSKVKVLIGVTIGLVLVSPLLYGMAKSPELGLTILGIPDSVPDFIDNTVLVIQQYFGFSTPSTTPLMTPVFGLGSMLIIAIGIYRLIKTRQSTRSYLILIWMLCLIPIIIINPQHTSVTFLPLVLLLCSGLGYLLGYWYGLFPRNPYARIAGLVPLVILVGALVLSGLERYVYGYHYDASTVSNFSNDLSLRPKDIRQLVVANDEVSFYSVVARHDKSLTLVKIPTDSTFVATSKANSDYSGYTIERIVTSSRSRNADRFYVYKKIDQ